MMIMISHKPFVDIDAFIYSHLYVLYIYISDTYEGIVQLFSRIKSMKTFLEIRWNPSIIGLRSLEAGIQIYRQDQGDYD